MSHAKVLTNNPSLCNLDEIPVLNEEDFWEEISENITYNDFRVLSLFGASLEGVVSLFCILGNDNTALIKVFRCELYAQTFQSYADTIPEIHLFEREIAEQFGLLPVGHPWVKPVRFEQDFALHVKQNSCGDMKYFKIESEDIHEVAVGPVHAGIIEPGHFRFQCYGESVAHLEISLGYQHRGIERALQGGPFASTLFQMETIAGDSTIAHTQAYVQLLELLSSTKVSQKSQMIRSLLLELERIANHVGDIGALAGDIGFLTTASYCGKLRGDFLNLSAHITGSRFGRGGVVFGGVGYDVDFNLASTLAQEIKHLVPKTLGAINLFFGAPSVLERLENCGKLTKEDALRYGFVGMVARACGIPKDTRKNYPFGYYDSIDVVPQTQSSCDVFARAMLRKEEIMASFGLVENLLIRIREITVQKPIELTKPTLCPSTLAVSITEGWRGEVVHIAITDDEGRFARYKITDPSFRNWAALALAMRGEQISDFPLCNKSFNFSYCGFDL